MSKIGSFLLSINSIRNKRHAFYFYRNSQTTTLNYFQLAGISPYKYEGKDVFTIKITQPVFSDKAKNVFPI